MPHSIKYKSSSNSIFVHLSGNSSWKKASLERCRLRLCLLLSWTLFYSNNPVRLRQYLKLNFFLFMVKDDQKVTCGALCLTVLKMPQEHLWRSILLLPGGLFPKGLSDGLYLKATNPFALFIDELCKEIMFVKVWVQVFILFWLWFSIYLWLGVQILIFFRHCL